MMNTMQKRFSQLNSITGFTLVETLVAVTIITIAVAGPMVTASRALLAANLSRDQLTASYLAQEGVEYVRGLRDQAYLTDLNAGNISDVSAAAWQDFIHGSGDVSFPSISKCIDTTCVFDPGAVGGIDPPLVPCSGNSCGPLYISNDIYTQKADATLNEVKTPFVRTIQAVYVSDTDEKIISKVTWVYHKQTYNVTITDHLTPWQ